MCRALLHLHIWIPLIPIIDLVWKTYNVIARAEYKKMCHRRVWMVYVAQNALADFSFTISHAHIIYSHFYLTSHQKNYPNSRCNRDTGEKCKNYR